MYRIIGADGKEYGPIPETQLRQWIAEGRVNAQTRVLVEGTTEWRTIADLPQFASAIPGPSPTAMPPPPMASLPSTPAPGLYSPAADQVNGPAIGLIILGALEILGGLIGLVFTLGHFGASMAAGSSDEFSKMIQGMSGGPLNILMQVAALGAGVLILFGGIKMKSLQTYGLCMTASIVAMLPFSCCCIIGLPLGIWSLVVLSKPEVKNGFQ